MDDIMTGTSAVLLVVYMILALVMYHKVFVVIYSDLFHGLMKELVSAFIVSIIMTSITLWQWKISVAIILIIAIILVLKSENNTKRFIIGISAVIVIAFIARSGIQVNKEMDEKANTEEETSDQKDRYEELISEFGDFTPEPVSESTEPVYEEENDEIDFDDDEVREYYEQPEIMEEEREETSSEYILPNSSSKLLKAKDLRGLSSAQCRLAKNEIYARHGRLFQDKSLQKYFDSKSWYSGYIEPEDFDEGVFSKIEKKNIRLLVKYENKG